MRILFHLILCGLLIASIEILFFLAYSLGIVLGKPIYRSEYFECSGCKYLDSVDETWSKSPNAVLGWDVYDPDIGWDSYRGGKRQGPLGIATTCGSAFGDSFTNADEVMDNEAWPFLLSELLGCKIENFGVNGYGLDQAYLKYLKYKPRGELVIVALFQEMMRRDFAASWRFYGFLSKALPKPLFRLHNGTLELEKPPPILETASIRRHHVNDRYAVPFVVEFPYSLALARVLYYRAVKTAFAHNRLEPHEVVWRDQEALALTSAILQRYMQDASGDRKRLVLLMLPAPGQVASNWPPYDSYVAKLHESMPDLCIVDPFASLRAKYNVGGTLSAPKGHFNKAGNEAIAQAVFNSLSNAPGSAHASSHTCSGLRPVRKTPS
jgi:hypothetical protein